MTGSGCRPYGSDNKLFKKKRTPGLHLHYNTDILSSLLMQIAAVSTILALPQNGLTERSLHCFQPRLLCHTQSLLSLPPLSVVLVFIKLPRSIWLCADMTIIYISTPFFFFSFSLHLFSVCQLK